MPNATMLLRVPADQWQILESALKSIQKSPLFKRIFRNRLVAAFATVKPLPAYDLVVAPITRADLADAIADLHAELRDDDGRPYAMEQIEKAAIDWLATQVGELQGRLEDAARHSLEIPIMELPPHSDEDQRAQAWLEYGDKVYADSH